MPTETLSISQYAKLHKKTRQAVLKAIADCNKGEDKSHLIPDIIDKKKVGNYYILEVFKR